MTSPAIVPHLPPAVTPCPDLRIPARPEFANRAVLAISATTIGATR